MFEKIKSWFKKLKKGSGAGCVIEIKKAIPEGMPLNQLKKAAIEHMTGEVYSVSDKFIPPKIQDYTQVNFIVGCPDGGVAATGIYCVGGCGGCSDKTEHVTFGPGGGVPGGCYSATGGNGKELYTFKFIKS